MSYFMLPGQLGAEPTTCPAGQEWNQVVGACRPRCVVEGAAWDEARKKCVGGEACPGTYVNGECVPYCGPDQVPHEMPNGIPSCYAEAPKPCPAGTERGNDPHTCVPVEPPFKPAPGPWVYLARAGGILVGVGVLVGLAWYSTRGSKGSMSQNPPVELSYDYLSRQP